jgi:hypothetical protein
MREAGAAAFQWQPDIAGKYALAVRAEHADVVDEIAHNRIRQFHPEALRSLNH